MEHYVISRTTLTSLANAIREKSGRQTELIFPQDFISEIEDLGASEYQSYNGTYEITPTVDSQKLETKGKLMRNDVTVREIPYYEVSNNYGNTIYIGSDLNA